MPICLLMTIAAVVTGFGAILLYFFGKKYRASRFNEKIFKEYRME